MIELFLGLFVLAFIFGFIVDEYYGFIVWVGVV